MSKHSIDKKFSSKSIFIISTILCIISVLIYHYIFDEEVPLDTVSHFFGGISVMVILIELNIYQTNTINIKAMFLIIFLSVLLFEIFEHLFFCYVLVDFYDNYYLGYIFIEPYFSDTIKDIIFGLLGGVILLGWRTRYDRKSCCK